MATTYRSLHRQDIPRTPDDQCTAALTLCWMVATRLDEACSVIAERDRPGGRPCLLHVGTSNGGVATVREQYLDGLRGREA